MRLKSILADSTKHICVHLISQNMQMNVFKEAHLTYIVFGYKSVKHQPTVYYKLLLNKRNGNPLFKKFIVCFHCVRFQFVIQL